ncbi:lipoprotein [Pantoea agglomerans]
MKKLIFGAVIATLLSGCVAEQKK